MKSKPHAGDDQTENRVTDEMIILENAVQQLRVDRGNLSIQITNGRHSGIFTFTEVEELEWMEKEMEKLRQRMITEKRKTEARS